MGPPDMAVPGHEQGNLAGVSHSGLKGEKRGGNMMNSGYCHRGDLQYMHVHVVSPHRLHGLSG